MNQKIQNSLVSKIRNLFKKDNMSNNIETTPEVKMFQWKKGDNFGKVVKVDSEDSEFYNFDDGTRIYKHLVNEFLELVTDVNNLPLPPTSIVSSKNVEPIKEIEAQPKTQPKMAVPTEKSPLENLIIKLSSKNVETLDLNIGINLPKREVFDMLLENSDESKDEMIRTISQVVTSQIQIDKLQSYINDQVIIFLNNYYNESNS